MRARDFALIVALIYVTALRAFALDMRLPLNRLRISSWTLSNGLPCGKVGHVVQTPDGYLWICDDSHVFRFDGKRFVELALPDPSTAPNRFVYDLKVDRQGELWIAGYGALYRRSLSGTVIRYDSADGIPPDAITCLSIGGDSSVCMGTRSGGAFVLVDHRCTQIWSPPPGSRHSSMKAVIAIDNRTWLIATQRAAVQVNRVTGQATEIALRGAFATDTINTLIKDQSGNVWCGTNTALLRLDNNRFVQENGDRVHSVHSLFQDGSGYLWIGSAAGQVFRRKMDLFESVSLGPQAADVLSFCEDAEGGVWVGSDGGLGSFSNIKFTLFTPENGLPDREVTALAPSADDSIWIGTTNGLALLRNGQIVRPDLAGGTELLDREINCIHEDSAGAVWIGTEDGRIYRFYHQIIKEIITPPPSGVYHAIDIADNGQGTVWVSVAGWGLLQLRDNQLERVITTVDGLDSIALGQILFIHGDLWILSDRGINVLRRDETVTKPHSHPNDPEQSVSVLYADSGDVIWAGTLNRGLIRLKDGRWAQRYCAPVNGLPASDIRAIESDDLGNLWLASSRGIYEISKAQLSQFFDGTINEVECRTFDGADGLNSFHLAGHGRSSCRTQDGTMVFANVNGIAAIDTNRVSWNLRPPAVHIEQLVVNEKAQAVSETQPQAILGSDTVSVGFLFAGLSLAAPEKVRYRYRLDGFERDWINAGGRNQAFYSKLPAGNYQFRVVASNNDGFWVPDSAAAAIQVVILPHFYQTFWFYGICAVLVAGLFWGLHRWKIYQILAERSRLARELHDTLAQSFVALIWQIERAKAYGGSCLPEPVKACLDRSLLDARDGLREARRVVHALRAGVLDESTDFLAALRAVLDQETTGGLLTLQLSVIGKPYQLASDWEQELIRILQESINNALKHAKAKRFDVDLEFYKHELRLRMSDDGRGFNIDEIGKAAAAELDKPQFSSGLGLIGMRERCHRLGGNFGVVSSPGQGTSIQIIVPRVNLGWLNPVLKFLRSFLAGVR